MTDTSSAVADKIRCDACPVMCYIKPGAAGACDRYANHNGELVRVDPHVVLERTVSHGGRLVPFQAGGDWDGKIVNHGQVFVTADPAFFGEMTMIATFEEVSGGTEVTLVFNDLPPGLQAQDNEAGSRLSLEQLARRFE